MIETLTLKNFRNFSSKTFIFHPTLHCIIGDNGTGKTNILEAVSLLCGKNILGLEMQDLVKHGESGFYIEAIFQSGNNVSLAYDSNSQKKQYSVSHKHCGVMKIRQSAPPSVSFQPIDMNMMYLAPSLRRDFLHTILSVSHREYESLYRKYKIILRNRNCVLKSIHEGKSQKQDIDFWDTQFIDVSMRLYNYIFKLINYFKQDIGKQTLPYFFGKIQQVEFVYKTKVEEKDLENSIKKYLEKNLERDIIIGSTHIGVHVDDFDILLDGKSLVCFASRGETKSVILGLKILETQYIRSQIQESPIILIDDFLSEIDSKHRNILFENFHSSQIIISSISELNFENNIYL